MKIHRSTSEAVVASLKMIFADNRYADKVIEKALKQNPKWGARDRRFIAETTYDIVRWYRWYRALAEAEENEYWKLLAVWCVLNHVTLPPWPEFEGFSAQAVRDREIAGNFDRSVRESIPDWMDALGVQELGAERWTTELRALNEPAQVVLRVNTLKTNRATLQRELEDLGILTTPLAEFPDALILRTRQNILSQSAFKQGRFEVQDAGSQLIAPWLQIEPGMRVIDACAGAGGKTLHIASIMQNKGRILAMDTEARKLDELRKRARRAGVTNVETRIISSTNDIERLTGTTDRLLLDVPCSGIGVLKRNPDAKWKLSPTFLDKVRDTQHQILRDYSQMVKSGGVMVYATCSIFPSENEQQVSAFLDSNADFSLVEHKHVYPSEGFDGFYMARLVRH